MRDENAVLAEKARQIVEDDAFRDAIKRMEADTIREMVALELDGTPESNAKAAELVREFKMTRGLVIKLKSRITNADLRDRQKGE